jgi:hypothetical protein
MKHGQSGTRIYQIWCSMKQRCYYRKHNRFENYGGRGITVCDKWLSFQNFFNDMNKSYKTHCKKHGERNTTIDRIDNNGDYSKKNCKWNTLWNQSLNRTNNHLLSHKGVTKPLTQWAREKGFKRGLLENRIRRGWSVNKMLETPTINKFSH